MRVLVVGAMPGAIDQAATELWAAGHDVARCHAAGSPPFPCFALQEGEDCPLDGNPVDVVVDVREGPSPQPTPFEQGAHCALRRHVPLVVTGDGGGPFEAWSTVVAQHGELDAACERAASLPLERHGEIATGAAAAMLERAGLDATSVHAMVHRHRGRLSVVLDLPTEARQLDADVVPNVITAIRAYDRDATGIDVTVEPTG